MSPDGEAPPSDPPHRGSNEPAAPEPDGKDWTWVLETPCTECGFDAGAMSLDDVAPRTRAAIEAMRTRLAGPSAGVRPQPAVWSALEYACHVRDVCTVFGGRLAAMRASDDPLFANWDQDETALTARYWEQNPETVDAELLVEGERTAFAFAGVQPHEWGRPGRRSNGSTFTIDTLARYFLHDLEHHVHDVSG